MIRLNRTQLFKYKGPGNGWRSIWLKDETSQISGAFKIRGVANYFQVHKPSRPIVTASTGNHGSAVAIITKALGLPSYLFVPTHIADKKKSCLRQYKSNVTELNGSYDDCESEAKKFAKDNDFIFIHSFEENAIIEGHRSIFHEIEQDKPDIPTFFVPVGGGGLLTAALRHYPERKIIGVEFIDAPALHDSLINNNRININLTPNPVEGLCVSKIGESVFNECAHTRPEIQLVNMKDIEEAIKLAWNHNNIKCEMAGAASLAAALNNPIADKDCICILSGGNIDEQLFKNIVH